MTKLPLQPVANGSVTKKSVLKKNVQLQPKLKVPAHFVKFVQKCQPIDIEDTNEILKKIQVKMTKDQSPKFE